MRDFDSRFQQPDSVKVVVYAIRSRRGLLFAVAFILWMIVYSGCYYFLFRGHPPAVFVAIKDAILMGYIFLATSMFCIRGFRLSTAVRMFVENWLLPLVLIALVYFAIDIQRAGSLIESVHSLRDLFMPFVILGIGIALGSRSNFPVVIFLRWFALLSIPVLLLGIYEHFFFTYMDAAKFGLIDESRTFSNFVRANASGDQILGVRSFGVFDSSIGMGLFCSAAFFNSTCGRRLSKPPERWLHNMVLVISVTALVFTFERATLGGALFGWLFTLRIPQAKKLFVSLVLVSGFCALMAWFTIAGGSLDLSTLGHLAAFGTTFMYLADKPWGYGISFSGTRPSQVPLDGDYLNVLLNVGPLGLFMFLRIYWKLLKIVKLSSSSSKVQACGSAVQAGAICLLVTMTVLMVYPNSGSWIFHLWLGVLAGVSITPDSTLNRAYGS
jgi:hypothetical protein